MRSVLAIGLLSIGLWVPANVAPVHHSKLPVGHLHPSRRVAVRKGYAVPGWTGEETRYLLNNLPR
jgi:hypothetical protein